MGLCYENLDGETRALMLEEFEFDAGDHYLSRYLNDAGCEQWPGLFRDAAAGGNDDTFAAALLAGGCFKTHTERRKPKGGFTTVAVPITAAQTLAESQFNMYYMRALTRRGIADGRRLQVYRAKEVAQPRRESEEMINKHLDPKIVLDALRETKGVEPPIGIPMPNSGITVRLVDN